MRNLFLLSALLIFSSCSNTPNSENSRSLSSLEERRQSLRAVDRLYSAIEDSQDIDYQEVINSYGNPRLRGGRRFGIRMYFSCS
jgi:hypothetical protein